MTVYLLCGPIASGKSTYAAAKKGAVTLSCDELMLTLFDKCLGERHNEIFRRTERYFYALSLDILRNGVDVCLDCTFNTKAERDEARAFYEKHDIKTKLIYFDVPRDIRLLRLMERNERLKASPRREYIITEEMLTRFDANFEIPQGEDFEYGNTQI